MKRAKAESDATIPEEQPNKLENKRHTKIIVYGRVVDSRSTKVSELYIGKYTKRNHEAQISSAECEEEGQQRATTGGGVYVCAWLAAAMKRSSQYNNSQC